MWSTLLLIAFCLNGANSMCFLKGTENTAKNVLSRPTVRDDYQCKLECANVDQCLSYTYANNNCVLVGAVNDPSGSVGEWVKKIEYTDCANVTLIDQPYLNAKYEMTAPLAQQIPLRQDWPFARYTTDQPCHPGAIIDIVLPNKTHRVYGTGASWIEWDYRLGAFSFTKQTFMKSKKYTTTTYILAANCFVYDPTELADTATCGGTLPRSTDVSAAYKRIGDVKQYGVNNYCGENASLIEVYTDIYVEQPEPWATSKTKVICVDGSWILVQSQDNETPKFAKRITKGTCMEYTMG